MMCEGLRGELQLTDRIGTDLCCMMMTVAVTVCLSCKLANWHITAVHLSSIYHLSIIYLFPENFEALFVGWMGLLALSFNMLIVIMFSE